VLNVNGTLRQDFQRGYIAQSGYTIDSRLYNGTSLGTSNIPQPVTGGGVINITFGPDFPIKGSVGDYYYNKISADQRQHLGQPTEGEVFLGNGLEWRQNFQNGTIFHGVKGSYIVQNSLRNTYNNELSAGDRLRLGMPIGNEIFSDHWYQVFEHGELQLVFNSPVKWTDGGNAQVSQTNGVRVGFDGTSAHNTYINTFNRSGGGGAIGAATNNVHAWANGYAQDFQGGNEGRGAILKSNANDDSYWVGGSFWDAYLATGHGADGALGYPTSNRVGNRQNFQNGALISGPNGIFAVYGGIGGHYLNNESGENGRLGAPTSGEIQVGGGKIVQRFQKGDILYGSGATSTLLTAGSAINYVNEFTAVVMPGVGVALRNTPREGDRSGYARNFNDTIRFDAWTTGDTLIDTRLGTPDNKWYHIKGTNYWVPSAYVNGDPGRSVVATPLQPTTNSGSSSTSDIPSTFNSRFYREDNFFWRNGFAPASTNPSSTNLGNAKGNCTWYVNGRLKELGYNSNTLDRLTGNASDWDDLARNAGIHISSTPQIGAIAQWEYGHVAVVEKVNSDGTIVISESSYAPGTPYDYLYKSEVVSASNPNRYIIIDKNISPNTITIPTLPGTIPILPGTTPIFNNIGNSITGVIGFTNNNEARYGILKRIDGANIEYGKETWVVIHGMNGSPTDDIKSLANAINDYSKGSTQVLTLDWSQAADSRIKLLGWAAPIPTVGGSFIESAARFVVKSLTDLGINQKSLINVAGHSLGAYVAYEISKQFNGINHLVALDPATNTGWGYPQENAANFSYYSNWSWGFYSSPLGQEDRAKTAKESFYVKLPEFSPWDQEHGAVVPLWTNLLKNKSLSISSYFGLDNFNSSGKPWIIGDGYEAEINASIDGTGAYLSKKVVYTSTSISGQNT
jgi:surface antigen/pimeloyl-ACP methyl ester carboxylesterase